MSVSWCFCEVGQGQVLTSLEGLDLLKGLALGLLPLLQLGDLDLLSELLEVPQLPGLRSGLLVGGLLDELGLDLLHVGVLLDHLGEVILGPGEGHALCDQLLAGDADGLEGLRVEGELALEVVCDVGDGIGSGRGGEDGLVDGEGFAREGDAGEGREEGGGVVDGEASVGDEVFLVFLVEIFEVGDGDVLLVLVLFLLVGVFVGVSIGNFGAVDDCAGLLW